MMSRKVQPLVARAGLHVEKRLVDVALHPNDHAKCKIRLVVNTGASSELEWNRWR